MLLLLLSFFSFVNFCVVFFFVPSILLCVRAFSFAFLPFPSRILFPLHFNVHFYCIYSACFFSCVPSLRRFIQLLLVSVYVYGLFSLLCRSLASFHNAKPLKCLSYIFFPHFYLDYRHVVWCSSVHFDYIYLNRKTVVHRMIFGFRFWCDGYWCRLNRAGKKYRTKFIVNRWKFGFAAPPNQ